MTKLSRRALARYAAEQLLMGQTSQTVAKNLAASLIELNMTNQSEQLIGDIAWELEHRGELTLSRVITARPLTEDLVMELKSEIKKATQTHDVLLENMVDKQVIGGARIETASRVWDGTVARKLRDLKETF